MGCLTLVDMRDLRLRSGVKMYCTPLLWSKKIRATPFVVIMSAVVFLACSPDKRQQAETGGEKRAITLNKRHSGYYPGKVNWGEFLDCYQGIASNEKKFLTFVSAASPQKFLIERTLPNSYRDFVKHYAERGGTFISNRDVENIGLFDPEAILELKEFNPELLDIDKEWKIQSRDDKYFVYGVNQDTAEGLFTYLENALVVGKHGESVYELILLYPDSVTLDGEFEASILSHSYEFRAPSFAELLRQLTYLFEHRPELMPPYAQKNIENGCSSLIMLVDVWWE